MRLPLRASLVVAVSAVLALILALYVPPKLIGKEEYARGHGRGDALRAASAFVKEASAADSAPAADSAANLLPAYAAAYPEMDFELLDEGLRVLASTHPGPSRYSLGELASRLEGTIGDSDDSESYLRELSGSGDARYLLVRLKSPFYVSFTRRASQFLAKGLAVAMVLTLLVFGIVLAAFSLPFARRVSRLARAISSYSPGSALLPERSRDETGEIARAFNAMSSRLALAEKARGEEEAARRREEEEWRSSVANLSHDLRTPLASVLGYSESLVSEAYAGEEERRRYEEIIHAKARYMAGLLDSLLEFARLDSPGPESSAEDFDLCELARSVVIEYLDEAERRGLAIEADIPGEPILVRARREALSRVLRNLLDNALKYGPSGRGLEVRLRADQGRSRLELRDFGPGIAASEREKIFERHYRVDPARGSRTGGLGLGLPIARAIARREGGDVILESPPDGGCCFVLLLPTIAAISRYSENNTL